MYVALANLTNGGLCGGSRKYLEVLAPLLARHSGVSRLDLFVPPQAVDGLRRNLTLNWESWKPGDMAQGFRGLRSELRSRRPDVVFIPNARWLDCGPIPVVAMVRNMEPLAVPFGENPWLEALRTLARRWVTKRACRKADRIIAVSQFVRNYLTARWYLSAAKISTVYHGVDVPEVGAETRPPAALNQLSQPFLFTAGSIRPYRGLEDAIAAMPEIRRRCGDLLLVIGGETDPAMQHYRRRLERLAESLGCANSLVWCGKLSQTEMAWCFGQCKAFLMTSRVEACPNTVLEAMAHACVSVSTDCQPMPEMYGETAFFYHPKDSRQLAEQVHTALNLPADQRRARQDAARRRSGDFSWQRTTDETVRELLIAAGRTGLLSPNLPKSVDEGRHAA